MSTTRAATASQLCRSTSVARSAAARDRNPGSARTAATASATRSARTSGTSSPVCPCRISSGIANAAWATHGSPAASASTNTMPYASKRDGMTKTSCSASSAPTRADGTVPRKSTHGGGASGSGHRGGPATVSRTSMPPRRSSSAAATTASPPLRRKSAPTNSSLPSGARDGSRTAAGELFTPACTTWTRAPSTPRATMSSRSHALIARTPVASRSRAIPRSASASSRDRGAGSRFTQRPAGVSRRPSPSATVMSWYGNHGTGCGVSTSAISSTASGRPRRTPVRARRSTIARSKREYCQAERDTRPAAASTARSGRERCVSTSTTSACASSAARSRFAV